MEELKPCPFCGKQPEVFKRPDSIEGFCCAISCFCGGYTARAYQFATDKTSADAAYEKAARLWNRRTALESKSLTVGDHIRSMTDKELAELLNHAENAGYADESIAPKGENNFPIDMLDWLRQPYVRKPEGSEST